MKNSNLTYGCIPTTCFRTERPAFFHVKGNQYGRQEEIYQCEDYSGCSYAERCKKTDKNRTVRSNHKLTPMHKEVIEKPGKHPWCSAQNESFNSGRRNIWSHEK